MRDFQISVVRELAQPKGSLRVEDRIRERSRPKTPGSRDEGPDFADAHVRAFEV